MTRTPMRFTLLALAAAAFIAVFASPAWAPQPVCPTCSIKTISAITPSEMVRVCLLGWITRPPSVAIDWQIGFFDAEGETVLTKETRVPQQGFRCVDTHAEELTGAGLAPEPSGRLQFGLRISPEGGVPLYPQPQPEKLTINGKVYHSVETINVLLQVVTSSHRLAHPDFLWLPLSTESQR
jgi:hypothetical protein